jgi:hypothetical protein
MATTKPVDFIDGLVAGTITAAYNVAFFFAAMMAVPFLRGTHRFWPRVIAAQRKLSSLTFLALSVITALLVIPGIQFNQLVATAAGLRASDAWIVTGIFSGIAVTLIVDVFARLLALLVRRRNEKVASLYESFFRLALGAMFMFAAATMIVFPPRGYWFVDLEFLFPGPRIVVVSLASLPLFVLLVKAYRIRDGRAVAGVGLLTVVGLAWSLSFISSFVYHRIHGMEWGEPPETLRINQAATDFFPLADTTDVQVQTFLRLDGADSLPLRTKDLAAECYLDVEADEPEVIATAVPDRSTFVLQQGRYMPVSFRARLSSPATGKTLLYEAVASLEVGQCTVSVVGAVGEVVVVEGTDGTFLPDTEDE